MFRTLVYTAIVATALALSGDSADAQTIVQKSGLIAADESWTADNIYVITGNVTVATSATLTIQPGTIVKFSSKGLSDVSVLKITVEGRLNVAGTEQAKVVFTSSADDTLGGDTNGNGTATSPRAGDYEGIVYGPGSQGDVRNVEFRYAARTGNQARAAAVRVESAANLTIDRMTVRDLYWAAISAGAGDNLVVTNFGVPLRSPVGGIERRGGLVANNVIWDQVGVAQIVTGQITVAENARLDIGSGVVVKFDVRRSFGSSVLNLVVEGRLDVAGVEQAKVIFTSDADDTVGGDTNGDGTATSPRAGDYEGIVYRPGSQGDVRNAEFRYGAHAGTYGSTSDQARAAVVRVEAAANLTIDRMTVRDLYWVAISAGAGDNLVVTNFGVPLRSPVGGIERRGGLVANNASWDQVGVAQIVTGQITVAESARLNIGSGVVVKFDVRRSFGSSVLKLVVEGRLDVAGTEQAKVIFTSDADDTVGGDTNGDGTATSPRAGDYEGIVYRPGSQGDVRNAEFRYGAHAGTYGSTSDQARAAVVRVESAANLTIDRMTVRDLYWAAISAGAGDNLVVTNFGVPLRSPVGGIERRGGLVANNVSWDQVGVAQIVTGQITVAENARLDIGSGVVVKYDVRRTFGSSVLKLVVEGRLDVAGTEQAKVVFTSDDDDTVGGDTNGNASATSPQVGDYEGIVYGPGSQGDVRNVEFRYGAYTGGYGGNGNQHRAAAVRVESAANLTIDRMTVRDLYWAAISAGPGDNLTVTNFAVPVRSPVGGIERRGGALIQNARWSQLGIAQIVTGNIQVADSARLSIDPGVVVKLFDTGFKIEGGLDAIGTPQSHIYFTSSRDDSLLSDTNGDAAATTPAAGNWGSLSFENGGSGTLRFVEVRYGSAADAGAIRAVDSSPVIENSILEKNRIALVASGQFAAPSISFSNIIGNTVRAVEARDGARIVARNNWWGSPSGPAANAVLGNVDTGSFLFFPADAPTPTPSPSPSPTPIPCAGDCNGNRHVEIGDLILATDVTLGKLQPTACNGLDQNNDQRVTIDELVRSVNRAAAATCTP